MEMFYSECAPLCVRLWRVLTGTRRYPTQGHLDASETQQRETYRASLRGIPGLEKLLTK